MLYRLVGSISAIKAFNGTGRVKMAAAAAILACAAIVNPARAAQTINVTFIAGFPPGATFVGAFVNGYVQAVDAALAKTGNYKINWNLAHSGQIAKPRGELEALKGGLGDIAVVPSPYYFDRVPLYEVAYATPFSIQDPAYLGKVFAMLEATFPQFEQAWTKLNQKVIITTINADNYILILTKPARKVSDLEGMKIGAVGPNSLWLSPIGATPVLAALSDWYPGLNTGIFEGVMGIAQALGAFKLCEPAKYVLDPRLGASGQINLNVNLSNFWNKLPEEVKKVMMEAGPVYDSAQVRLLVEGSKKAYENCGKQHGLVVTTMAEEDRVRWAKRMPNIAQQWAERMERQGLPGKDVLKVYMDAARAAKEPIPRHWDRE